VPQELLVLPPQESVKGFGSIWLERARDLVILSTGLFILAVALAMQKALTASAKAFAIFRRIFLAFTLFLSAGGRKRSSPSSR